MNNKKLAIIGIAVFGALLIIIAALRLATPEDNWLCVNGEWVKHGQPSAPKPTGACGEIQEKITEGVISEIQAGPPKVIKITNNEGKEKSVVVSANTKIKDDKGGDVNFEFFKKGFTIKVKGPEANEFISATEINILKAPDLIPYFPRPNDIVKSPIIITGEARGNWYFEATFPVKLVDESGKVIASHYAQAEGEWMTADYVPFKSKLNFEVTATTTATLILEKDNPSGLPENAAQIEMPVILTPAVIKVKAFFNNNNLDKEITCVKVFSVDREVIKTQAVARAALEELLKGPTEEEKTQGYLTNINAGVKIQKLTIENGIAKVDFDKTLEEAVGGSCRVTAISAQIAETLKQFSTVKKVIISIDGRTKDILQP